MAIYIKGMELPYSCLACPLHSYNMCRKTGYDVTWEIAMQKRRNDCPLVEVPDHGRLIDADALMLKIKDYIEEYSEIDDQGLHNDKWCAMKETEMAINDAPTVIQADKEGAE